MFRETPLPIIKIKLGKRESELVGSWPRQPGSEWLQVWRVELIDVQLLILGLC